MKPLYYSVHRYLLLCCLLSFSLLSRAQDVSFTWGHLFIGTGGGLWCTNTADAGGNVYMAGFFSGTADFDPGSNIVNRTAIAYQDAFIV